MIYLFLVSILLVLLFVYMLISKGFITIKTRSSSVEESKYLRRRRGGVTDSAASLKKQLIYPFSLNIEPMDKLILFDIEKDPLYTTLELQEFNDETSKGLVILMYRKDKEIDVYYTSGINHDFYKGSQNGSIKEIATKEYYFNKTNDDFRFLINFIDKENREIYIKADEKNPEKKHFSILAPAGDMIDNFTSFPLFFMKETAFLEKDRAQITIRIGEEKREPVCIPISINGKFVYLSRYCLEPVVASINENFTGKIDSVADDISFNYSLTDDLSREGLITLNCNKLNHRVSLNFSPPIPDLLSLKNNEKITGRFSTSVDNTKGILAGKYCLKNSNGEISISLRPLKGWQPMPGKKWFKNYKWISSVSLKKDGVYADSKWIKQ